MIQVYNKFAFVPPTVASTPLIHRDRCLSGVEGNICAKFTLTAHLPVGATVPGRPCLDCENLPLTIPPKTGARIK